MGTSFKNDKKILVGRIGAAHGLKGQVRLLSFTQNPLSIADFGPLLTDKDEQQLTITTMRPFKKGLIVHFQGIPDRNAAETLNGMHLYVMRDKIPDTRDETEFLHADLVGLEVRNINGTVIGHIVDVPNYGAGDLLEIKPETGQTILLPFTSDVVPTINIEQGFLIAVPPLEISGERDK